MECIFCKIANHEIGAKLVLEDQEIMVFHDLLPQAPTHLLVIPKRHIATVDDIQPEDGPLLGKLIVTAKQAAVKEGISPAGYRLVFNVNEGGGQEVYHLHLHVLGGRPLSWPPG